MCCSRRLHPPSGPEPTTTDLVASRLYWYSQSQHLLNRLLVFLSNLAHPILSEFPAHPFCLCLHRTTSRRPSCRRRRQQILVTTQPADSVSVFSAAIRSSQPPRWASRMSSPRETSVRAPAIVVAGFPDAVMPEHVRLTGIRDRYLRPVVSRPASPPTICFGLDHDHPSSSVGREDVRLDSAASMPKSAMSRAGPLT